MCVFFFELSEEGVAGGAFNCLPFFLRFLRLQLTATYDASTFFGSLACAHIPFSAPSSRGDDQLLHVSCMLTVPDCFGGGHSNCRFRGQKPTLNEARSTYLC